MFWTALICGAGGSLGACVGLIAFTLMFGLLKTKDTTAKDYAERSLVALLDRNRLAAEMIDRLDMIAASIDRKPA